MSIFKYLLLSLAFLLSLTAIAGSNDNEELYPYRQNLHVNHPMQILNSGIGALWARVDMIRRANETLELEYFIFNTDKASRIILRELVEAAKRGVKVRLLVDKSAAVFVLDEFFAEALKKKKVEVRYYNAASIIQISTVQFRNHRKMISRDGVEAITGGRNIADEYFDLSETFNFLDRDVWVEGPIVKTMVETFDRYWKSDIVETPKKPEKPIKFAGDKVVSRKERQKREIRHRERVTRFRKNRRYAHKFLNKFEKEDSKALLYAETYGVKALKLTKKHTCPHVGFASDREGGDFAKRVSSADYHLNYRLLRKEIAKWLGYIETEVTLDSPYFLNNSRSREALENMLEAGQKVNILTNSLGSTDAIYVSTVFTDEVRGYAPLDNFSAYIYTGKFSNESELMNSKIRNAVWGTHSKTIVFNDQAVMVGTFNIDNRSSYYNTEMAIFCNASKEIRDDVMDNIELRMKHSKKLGKNGRPEDGTSLLANSSFTKKLLYFFLKVPATLLKFLL